MSDLAALSTRVVAAQEHLGQAEDERQQMSTRLLELVNSVEAALGEKQTEINGYLATIETLRGENQELRTLLERLLALIEGSGENAVSPAVQGLGNALAALGGAPEAGGSDDSPAEDDAVASEAVEVEAPADLEVEPEAMTDDAVASAAVEEDAGTEIEAAADEAPVAAAEVEAELEVEPEAEIEVEPEAEIEVEPEAEIEVEPEAALEVEPAAEEPAAVEDVEAEPAGDLELGAVADEAEMEAETGDAAGAAPEPSADVEAVASEGAAADADSDALLDQASDEIAEMAGDENPAEVEEAADATAASDDEQVADAEAEAATREADDSGSASLLDNLPPGDPERVKAIIDRVSKLADEMAGQMAPDPVLAEKPAPKARAKAS